MIEQQIESESRPEFKFIVKYLPEASSRYIGEELVAALKRGDVEMTVRN